MRDYKNIAILDDVLTTGATAKSLCTAIKKNTPHMKISLLICAKSQFTQKLKQLY